MRTDGGKAMKIFLDTGSVSELREATAMGLLDGVTTNPSLVAKEKRSFRDLVDEICRIVDGPVSLEVVATDTDGMVQQGRELAKIAPNVVVKLPTTVEGPQTCRGLRGGNQDEPDALLLAEPGAARREGGAAYVSPFLGRLDDIAHVGMDLIRTIRRSTTTTTSRPRSLRRRSGALSTSSTPRWPAPTSRPCRSPSSSSCSSTR